MHPLYGHEELRSRLATSMRASRLPTALLLTGAAGVGKQRLGLWIAQGLLCENGPGEPCGACHSCRLATGLSHPDIHWFFPIARPRGEEDKQADIVLMDVSDYREVPYFFGINHCVVTIKKGNIVINRLEQP